MLDEKLVDLGAFRSQNSAALPFLSPSHLPKAREPPSSPEPGENSSSVESPQGPAQEHRLSSGKGHGDIDLLPKPPSWSLVSWHMVEGH